jgi:hypothetical protein
LQKEGKSEKSSGPKSAALSFSCQSRTISCSGPCRPSKPRSWPELHRTRAGCWCEPRHRPLRSTRGFRSCWQPEPKSCRSSSRSPQRRPGSQQSCSQICRCRRVVVGVVVVDQAGCGDRRHAGQGAAKLLECSIANCRIGREVTDFASNDGALASGRGRIVGSHTGAH